MCVFRYLLYSNQKRGQLKESNPAMGPKDIMTALGAGWKLLDDSSKVPFEEEAKRAKVQYETDLASHKATKTNSSSASSSSASSSISYQPVYQPPQQQTYNPAPVGIRKAALDFYLDARRSKIARQYPTASVAQHNVSDPPKSPKHYVHTHSDLLSQNTFSLLSDHFNEKICRDACRPKKEILGT